MESINKDLLLVIKYIEDNKDHYMFPFIRTICSFINNNQNSPFVEIFKKYPNIANKKYNISIEEMKYLLNNLVNSKLLYIEYTYRNKKIYHLSDTGKKTLNDDNAFNSLKENDIKHITISWAKQNKILDYKNPDFLSAMFNLIIQDSHWRYRKSDYLCEEMNILLDCLSPEIIKVKVPISDKEFKFRIEEIKILPELTRYLPYKTSDYNIDVPEIIGMHLIKDEEINDDDDFDNNFNLKINYSNHFIEKYLRYRIGCLDIDDLLSTRNEDSINYVMNHMRDKYEDLMDYLMGYNKKSSIEYQLKNDVFVNEIPIILPDYSFEELRYPDRYSFIYWYKKEKEYMKNFCLTFRYCLNGVYILNDSNLKELRYHNWKYNTFISSTKEKIAYTKYVYPHSYSKFGLSLIDPTSDRFDVEKDLLSVNSEFFINDSTVLYLVFLDYYGRIIKSVKK